MQTIEFETPTLNNQGEVIAWTRHTTEQFTQDLRQGCSLDMLIVPAGIFQMGSPRQLGNSDEWPQHLVSIKSFLSSIAI